MKCPKCNNAGPSDAKFCFACGHKLGSVCTVCETVNPPGGKFCITCGRRLPRPSSVILDEPASDAIPSDGPAVGKTISPLFPTEGERKYVTVLLSDLSNYTALSKQLDPEEVREILNRIYGEISKIVAKYGGFIEKFLGDAVMALFGAITSQEDDPIRAIRAAREIHHRISGLTAGLEDRIGLPLSMHTGINTGLIVTDGLNFQNGSHGVSGATPNLAVHLSELAKPGEILVGPETHRLTRRYVSFDSSELVRVKGISKPVGVFRVSSMIDRPVKIHRFHGLRADLIGRAMELELLSDAVQKLKVQKGSVFTICGNAGTGKSRLIESFKSTLNLEKVFWLEGQCYPYTRNITYSPLIDMLNKAFRIEEDDPPQRVREKISSGLRFIRTKGDIVPYIGSLYNLSYPELGEIRPEIWRIRLQQAILEILNAMACKAPTIICLEDLHWADPSSLELIRFLLSDFRYPALIICVHRPPLALFSSRQIADFGTSYTEIRLEDLSASETMSMVESLLKSKQIPFELKKFLREEAGGNPFYLEEVINSLVESQTLGEKNGRWLLNKKIHTSDIPTTIHGVIAARLDRLDKDMKRLLQESSVIGRAFYYEILNRISEIQGNIWQYLSGLETLDLIKVRSFQPVVEYIFKHALTQEVVYGSLLKKESRAIHARTGHVMEQIFKDRLPEYYEALAFHFSQAQSYGRAFDYLVRSGEKSLGRYALEEAHAYYRDAYEIISNRFEKSAKTSNLMIDLLNRWSFVYYYRGQYKELLALLTRHQSLAESINDKAGRGMFYAWLGWALWHRERFEEAHRYLFAALKIGEEKRSKRVTGYACCWLPWVCTELGMLDDAVLFAERAEGIFKTGFTDPYIYYCAMAGKGYANWHRGDRDKTLAVGKALLEFGEVQGDQRASVMGYCCIGWSHLVEGDLSQAVTSFAKAVQVSVDPWYALFPRLALTYGLILAGKVSHTRDHIAAILEFSDSFGAEFAGKPALFFQGIIFIAEGRIDQGLKIVEKIYQSWVENGCILRRSACGSMLAAVYAGLARQIEDPNRKNFAASAAAKAHTYFKSSIESGKQIGANGALGRAYLNWGYLHQQEGSADRAERCFTAAIEYFRLCNSDTYLVQARKALAELDHKTDDRDQTTEDPPSPGGLWRGKQNTEGGSQMMEDRLQMTEVR
ncbi:MAG: AAA family ATPase [Desulfobacterales bacterium]|nr:MAG: AAA family ATPase [Desulfobacterales bacterium]